MKPRPARRVALITLHYPPFVTSSGYLRTTKLQKYLPGAGWEPVIVTATRHAFDPKTTTTAPAPDGNVHRAFALDTARHLAIRGRYPSLLAAPDRWVMWLPAAVWALLAIHRKNPIHAIVSTYPVATAHLIGLAASRLLGVPWVADFRDPMVAEGDHYTALQRKVRMRLEEETIRNCAAATFTAPGTLALYRHRYPGETSKFNLIFNGYDEADFAIAASRVSAHRRQAPITLVHSGVLYRDIRNPQALFEALQLLRQRHPKLEESLQVVLRNCGPEDHYRRLISEAGLQAIVRIEGALPYHDALAEMLTSGGLLLLQGRGANRQVPAKLFEYLRAGRPIIALVDHEGDTATILRENGIRTIADMNSAGEIANLLECFIKEGGALRDSTCARDRAERYSRASAAQAFAAVLDAVEQR